MLTGKKTSCQLLIEEVEKMARFKMEDLRALEQAPTSPGALGTKFGELIVSSTSVRAKVEGMNTETGEYRIVLQGTLDWKDAKWDQF